VHEDDLKTVWQCHECGRNFIYHSDVEDHMKAFNHSRVTSKDLSKNAEFIRDQAAFTFKVDGRPARVIIEFKYYPSTDALVYVDVRYTDDKLQSFVEDDPKMMRNIDNLLRKHLQSSRASRPQKV
jgi:hypothetical protein